MSMARRRASRLAPPRPLRREAAAVEAARLRALLERQELILRELEHRNRNLFLVASSILTLSARSDPSHRAFADVVRRRFDALARAQAFVAPGGGGDHEPTLKGLLAALLAPWQSPGDHRIDLIGDDLVIAPDAATSLALLFQELATNAVKYGALSRPSGRVRLEGRQDAASFALLWEESGGPAVAGPPTRQGFGSVLTGRVPGMFLGATIGLDWRPAGLVVRLDMPLHRLVGRSGPISGPGRG
jgi:two-component sensor histidine kinase